jgi:hypothetical protein
MSRNRSRVQVRVVGAAVGWGGWPRNSIGARAARVTAPVRRSGLLASTQVPTGPVRNPASSAPPRSRPIAAVRRWRVPTAVVDGPREERPGGHDQGQHQHRTEPQAQVGHDGVVGHRGGVMGQHRGRHGVQVDGPEHRQRQAQQHHPARHPEGGPDQRPAVAFGHPDPDPEQHDGDDRQPDPERVEQVERGLGAGEVLDVEQDEGGVDLRDPGGQGEPGSNQPLLDRLDEGGQVDADGVVVHRDRPVALAGQGLDQRLVGDPVGLHPGIGERLALDDLADLGADKALYAVGQRAGEPAQPVGQLGGNALLGQRVDCLRAHTATPASGASTQPTTINTTATIVRQRCRDPGPEPATPRSSPLSPSCSLMLSASPSQSCLGITPNG